MGHNKHIMRLLGVLGTIAVLFVVVRTMAVPKDFGKTGHFRFGAIEEEKAKTPRFQGADACKNCHAEVFKIWTAGKHKHHIQCENCHGPRFWHIRQMNGEPDATPPKAYWNATGIVECKRCHVKTFERAPQVKSIESVQAHVTEMGGTFNPTTKCTDCHNQHSLEVK